MLKKNKGLTKKHALRASKYLQEAVTCHQAGNLQKAEGIYQYILERYPNHPEAHYNLGVTLQSLNRVEEAVVHYEQAVVLKPDFAEAYINLGNALQILGRVEEAVARYEQVIVIKPNYTTACISLGHTLQSLGRLEEAIIHFEKAIVLNPDFVEAYVHLGNALQSLGRGEEAIARYEQFIVIRPNFAAVYINLGNTLQSLGRAEEAIAHYEKAIVLKPDYAEAHHNLGLALHALGKGEDAIISHRRAIALSPQDNVFWLGLASSIETLTFSSFNENILQDLCDLLEWPTIDPYRLIQPIISALRHHPEFSQLLKSMNTIEREKVDYEDVAKRLSSIPLLLNFMALSVITDHEIEIMLTVLRRSMIFGIKTDQGMVSDKTLPFSAALALHCFTNDYIFQITTEETAIVEHLSKEVAMLSTNGQEIPPALLVALATYRPLYQFPWSKELLKRDLPNDLKPLITRQVQEPLEEIALYDQIPCLTNIENKVSQAVRGQYEVNPYPRWIKGDFPAEAKTIRNVLESPLLRFDLGDYVTPKNPRILVPGCGTGHQALYVASRYSNATIMAVDLSLKSIAYAMRKTHEQGFTNIDYAQADIMELGDLGQQFDVIDCSGVLHHLEDPLSGWRILLDLLEPGGLMKIGLYSTIARQNISKGRLLVDQKVDTTSPEGIRQCRQEIVTKAEDGNREMEEISKMIDFYNLSECRDLLFHVQEHCFTLPQIEAALQEFGLKFLGFELRDQKAMTRFKTLYSVKSALTSLPLWHEFETQNPNTFLGMYQFWVRKT